MHFEDLTGTLRIYNTEKIVFVGLGNSFRGDDISGIYLINKIRKTKQFRKALFFEAGNTPENYIYPILDVNPEAVVFIDAAKCGGNPGDIRFIEKEEISGLSFSTHSYSIGMIEKMLQTSCNTDIYYIGIEPAAMQYTQKISPSVMSAVNNFFNGV